MAAVVLFVALFLLISIPRNSREACVTVDQCPVVAKYFELRRNDPQAITILRNANCGRIGESKVNCEQIPDFDDNPEDCVVFTQCPRALELLQSGSYDPLRAAICGSSPRLDMVRCKQLGPIVKNDEECGSRPATNKIFSGSAAELEEYPWLALLKHRNSTGHSSFPCHGSLINRRFVVTAAHCLSVDTKTRAKVGNLVSVILGEYDVRTEKDCVGDGDDDCNDPVQEVPVKGVHVHSNFDRRTPPFDIALVELERDAVYTDYVKPICLPTTPLSLRNHEPVWVAGWGKIENGTYSNIKLYAKLTYYSSNECSNRIRVSLDDTQLCAGSDAKADSCKGDSGGPLMVERDFDGSDKIILAGIVSFGIRCGDKAAVYTNVSRFLPWIMNTIKN